MTKCTKTTPQPPRRPLPDAEPNSQEPFAVDTNGREYSLDDITTILHILRNPAGWSEETVREVRLKAADLIEGMSYP